jgi:DNA-binding phage protein
MAKHPTGAEKYFADRMLDPAYRAEHAAATERIRSTDAIVRALDEKREASGLSKAELARRADLPPEAVRRLFSADNANPTLGTITALAGALNVELVLQSIASTKR